MANDDPSHSITASRLAVLLFTDIVGSTDLKRANKLGDTGYLRLLQRHNDLFEAGLRETSGKIIKHTGDGYFAEFPTSSDAVRFALTFQSRMGLEPWQPLPLTTRVGIHVGEISSIQQAGQSDVIGQSADLAARIMSLAAGGQILLTTQAFNDARQYVREGPKQGERVPPIRWLAHGPYLFKGAGEPLDIFEVGIEGFSPLARPADGEKAKRVARHDEEPVLGWRPAPGLDIPNRENFRLVKKLGEGGFGEVWLAEQLKLKQQHVFKFCFNVDRVRSLKREFTLFRLLQEALGDRTDIVKLIGYNLEEAPFFIESEFTPGGNLLDWAESRGGIQTLPLDARITLVADVASAVAAAHSVGVLHKDIKPSNILIEEDKGDAPTKIHPKLADFGIGFLADPTTLRKLAITEMGFTQLTDLNEPGSSRTGTRMYSPPESLTSKPLTTQSDVYALGVLLYQVVAADLNRPLAEGWREGIADELVREDIAACVAFDPLQRPTAAGLAERLRSLDARRKTLASERDTARREQQKARRRRLAGIGAAAATVLAIVSGVVGWKYVTDLKKEQNATKLALTQATEQRDRADKEAAEAVVQRNKAEDQGYFAALAAASAKIEANQMGVARDLLDQTAPGKRKWEWRYLRAVSDTSLAVLKGHSDAVRSAAFSPDGTRVLTAADDNTARVWDPTTAREVAVIKGHKDRVNSAAFSPDGTRVVTASDDKTARVWDAATGRELTVLKGHENPVWSVAFAPDGTRVVTASKDKTARVWEAATGRELAVLKGHTYSVWSAAFSPDGTRVVTASDDESARIWDAANGRETAMLRGHESLLVSAAFSPDGTRVVTASHDETARVWDASNGREMAVLRGHDSSVVSAVFSADGTRILTVTYREIVRVWDAASGREIAVLKGHEDSVSSAAFSPDGTRVVTASYDNTARVWDAASGREMAVLRGHADAVASAAFSPDGTRVVTASKDNTARIWAAPTSREETVFEGHEDSVSSAAFSPDGNRVVTASWDKTARVWDAASGREMAVLRGHADAVASAAFSPDGTRVVTASWDKTARVWDVASGHEMVVLKAHTEDVFSAAFSPDGTRVVTASFDTTARVWDAASGHEMVVLKGHANRLVSAAFSPDGTRVVTASMDKTARVWDAASGREVAVLKGHANPVYSAVFSPDGMRVVTASFDDTARVWDAATGREVTVIKGHKSAVSSAAFSPDGTRVLTGSFDKTARVWDSTTGREMAVLRGHKNGLNSAAFSPDGTRVVTASYDKTVRIYDSVSVADRYKASGLPLVPRFVPTSQPTTHPTTLPAR